MARNLSSLVHELRERIAASSSTPPNSNQNDGALESRFRAVLPSLLHAYVVPSSSGILFLLLLSSLFNIVEVIELNVMHFLFSFSDC